MIKNTDTSERTMGINMKMSKHVLWETRENLLLIEGWCRRGLTDEQIAEKMEINIATLYRWKKKSILISEALKNGKEVADINVEKSLYTRACGIHKTIKKPMKLKKVKYDNGKRVSEEEIVEYVEEEIYIPGDTTAQIFWLKNRRPDLWRDKVEATIEGPKEISVRFEDINSEYGE